MQRMQAYEVHGTPVARAQIPVEEWQLLTRRLADMGPAYSGQPLPLLE